jgi:hypothetical protein
MVDPEYWLFWDAILREFVAEGLNDIVGLATVISGRRSTRSLRRHRRECC